MSICHRYFLNITKRGVFGLLAFFVFTQSIAATIPSQDVWMPNGPVYSTLVTPSTLYIGGDFTYVGPSRGYGVALDSATAELDADYAKVNGPVHAVVSDGSGGWYIGGSFTLVGSDATKNIAHINSDGSLDTDWVPNITGGIVNAMVLIGSTLYVGGTFTTVDSMGHNSAAGLNVNATASPYFTGWNPNVTDASSVTINSMIEDGTWIYIGGDFDAVGGVSITGNNIARVDIGTGVISATWSPNITGGLVNAMVLSVSTNTLYVGGTFTTVDGVGHNSAAGLDVNATASPYFTGWNPDVTETGTPSVNAMSLDETTPLDGDTLYIGGDFDTVGTTMRNNIARFNSENLDTNWDPNSNDVIFDMVLSGKTTPTLFVAGDFLNIGGKARSHIAELSLVMGNAETWSISIENTVRSLAMSGSTVLYAGGDFVSMGGDVRNGLAALDVTNAGDILAEVNGTIFTVVSDNASGWYIGGDFTAVAGIARNKIAHINADNTLDLTWDPNANNTVYSMALSGNGSILYVGGLFTNIDGVDRNSVAALDTTVTTNIDTGWDPDVTGGIVYAMALSGTSNTLFIGGDFTAIAGVTRNRVAALNTAVLTSIDTGWDPDANAVVRSMAVSSNGNLLFIGGDFTQIEGAARNRVAALDTAATSNIDSGWNPDVIGGSVKTIVLSTDDSTLYIGGDFTQVDGVTPRNRLRALDTAVTTNIDTGWNPDVTGTGTPRVNAMVLSSNETTLYIGGDFTMVGTDNRIKFAAIDTSSGMANSLTTSISGNVHALALFSGVLLYLGGENVAVVSRIDLMGQQLGFVVGTLTTFNPNVNSIIRTMALSADDMDLYIGGDFAMVGGQARDFIAKIDTTNGISTSWDPDPNAIVRAMVLSSDDTTLYVGGDFTAFNMDVDSRLYIAAIDTTSATVTPWAPDADDVVRTLLLTSDDARLYAGGDFSVIGQQSSMRLAALSTSSGAAIPSWAPIVNGAPGSDDVYSIVLSGDESILYVGGDFTDINSSGGRNRIAALNTSNGTLTSFNPNSDGRIETLVLSSDDKMLYVGGGFSDFAIMPPPTISARDGIARFNLVNDTLTPWAPNANANVHSLALADNNINLYIGGDFTAIGGDGVRKGLAAISVIPPDTGVSPPAGSYSVTPQTVTLTCQASTGTMCDKIYFTNDDTTPMAIIANEYAAAPSIMTTTTLKYFSVDNEGTQGQVKTSVFKIDSDKPITAISPLSGTYKLGDAPVVLDCNDDGDAGCENTYYTTDGSTPTTNSNVYVGPIPLASIEGNITFSYFSVDNAGNAEAVQSVAYVIDVTPPVTTNSHNTGTYFPPLTITLTCDDSSGTGCDKIYYTTDLTVPSTSSIEYTGPITFNSGTTVRAMSVDVAGNIGFVVDRVYAFTLATLGSTTGVGHLGPIMLLLAMLGLLLRYTHLQIQFRRMGGV